jgi:hypothetical protein
MRTLPFRPYFVKRIAVGAKTTTARTEKYGDVGDKLKTAAGVVELTEVAKVRLDTVRDHYWRDEGVSSPDEFEQVWRSIHPRKGFVPEQEVWLHRFRLYDHSGEAT